MFVMDEMNNLEFFARLARLFVMDKTRFVLSFFGEVKSSSSARSIRLSVIASLSFGGKVLFV